MANFVKIPAGRGGRTPVTLNTDAIESFCIPDQAMLVITMTSGVTHSTPFNENQILVILSNAKAKYTDLSAIPVQEREGAVVEPAPTHSSASSNPDAV